MRKAAITAFAFAFTLAFAPVIAWAQKTEAMFTEPTWVLPDPATIEVPDINVKPEFDSSGDAKYFFFWKEGVSFETAAHDFRECLSYTRDNNPTRLLPAFATIVEVPATPRLVSAHGTGDPATNQFGLVGAVIGGMVVRGLERRHRLAVMRMCMGFKNYRRYPTNTAIYIALNEGDPMSSIYMRAKIASGPAPKLDSVAP